MAYVVFLMLWVAAAFVSRPTAAEPVTTSSRPGGGTRALVLQPLEDPIDSDSRLLGKVCSLELYDHERRVLGPLRRPCRSAAGR